MIREKLTVNGAVGKVGRRPDQQDGVGVDGPLDFCDLDFARDGVDGDVVDLDPEIVGGLVERGVHRDGDDPVGTTSRKGEVSDGVSRRSSELCPPSSWQREAERLTFPVP